ncbi:hypothetical protein ES332_A11G328500v1 [Gossypium tomentosum]|uniref:Uncharacterized protein n=1 Tax=Gossypium tomentosum TaxID=34277 RepID=A0A5D2NGQ2_GOSTO|nr:hypothetical protein ES332_A11G328500v1 [Gossypium tomentosum]
MIYCNRWVGILYAMNHLSSLKNAVGCGFLRTAIMCYQKRMERKRSQALYLICPNFQSLELDPTALMKMRKLRFLKLYNSCGRILLFKGLLSFPEELRYLYWEGYPLRSLPTKFDLRYLVELDMRESHLEQLWEGKQDLVNLKVINLNMSKNLVRIPDLSSATNLEEFSRNLRDHGDVEGD